RSYRLVEAPPGSYPLQSAALTSLSPGLRTAAFWRLSISAATHWRTLVRLESTWLPRRDSALSWLRERSSRSWDGFHLRRSVCTCVMTCAECYSFNQAGRM